MFTVVRSRRQCRPSTQGTSKQTPWKTSGSSEIQGMAILLIVSETLDLNFSERKTQSRPVTGPPRAEEAGDGRR